MSYLIFYTALCCNCKHYERYEFSSSSSSSIPVLILILTPLTTPSPCVFDHLASAHHLFLFFVLSHPSFSSSSLGTPPSFIIHVFTRSLTVLPLHHDYTLPHHLPPSSSSSSSSLNSHDLLPFFLLFTPFSPPFILLLLIIIFT